MKPTQPLHLNHEGNSLEEIMGMTKAELNELADELKENSDSLKNKQAEAATYLTRLSTAPDITIALLGTAMSILYDEEFTKLSEIVERLVNAECSSTKYKARFSSLLRETVEQKRDPIDKAIEELVETLKIRSSDDRT